MFQRQRIYYTLFSQFKIAHIQSDIAITVLRLTKTCTVVIQKVVQFSRNGVTVFR